MRPVLICAPDPLSDELHATLLWREGLERHLASRFDEALMMAVAVRPRLIMVDRDLPQAQRLIESLRSDAVTREVSIAVMARGAMEGHELTLLEAGANAVMRLPAGPEWDARLAELLYVAPRRAVRLPVRLELEARLFETEVIHGTVLNLSTSGMLVETAAKLAVGADLEFAFAPADLSVVSGAGQVVREAGPRRFGVRFHLLEGDGEQRVRSAVEGGG